MTDFLPEVEAQNKGKKQEDRIVVTPPKVRVKTLRDQKVQET